MESVKEQKGITIPRSIVWGIIVAVIGVLLTTWITFEVRFVCIEKEIEVIKINIESWHRTNETNSQRFEKIQQQLHDIEMALTIKQDKKFIE